MNKKLYRAAFISAPIIGLIASTPIYIIGRLEFQTVFILWIFLTVIVFVYWTINIYIISKVSDSDVLKRYAISYVSVILFQGMSMLIIHQLNLNIFPENMSLYPLVPATGINTIIIILSNSIILQFQKRNAELEIEQLKVTNLEAQKVMLIQQLQPHFLFNALSTLKSLISEDPSKAEDYTVRLSEFLRYTIQAQNMQVVTLEASLKFTNDYVELQKVRFGDSFDCKIEIPTDTLQKKVPVYAVQTLVENAIKHNSFTDKKPLLIQILVEGSRLKVINNISPKILQNQSGTGLQNLNQRYKMIANVDIETIKTEHDFSVFIYLLEK